MTSLGVIDMLVTHPLTGALDRPSMRLEDWTGVGRFVRESPARNNRYVGELYANLQSINTTFADIAGLRLLGKKDKARNVERLERGKAVWRDLYSEAQPVEARIQRAINSTYASTSMTAASKRARIDSLTRRKNQIARSMVTRPSWSFK